jgi:hypothetical protein
MAMGFLSWLFPSDEDRLRKARDLMARGLYGEARRALVGCKATEAAALDDECAAAIAGAAAPAPSGRSTARARRKGPRASVRSRALPEMGGGAIVDDVPLYSALKGLPSGGLPADFAPKTSLDARTETLRSRLLYPANRPSADKPLFVELLAGEGGVVTLPLPKGGRALLIFTSPLRAADYTRTLLPKHGVQYLTTSPRQLTKMLRDLHEGVESFILDRCPRCLTFAVVQSDPTKDAEDVVNLWAIIKSTELARTDLFVECALEAARAGRLETARDVALQAAGHVTLEDPRIHLLLGQLAVGLGDDVLLEEAKAFLAFLEQEELERQLDSAIQAGSPDFADG